MSSTTTTRRVGLLASPPRNSQHPVAGPSAPRPSRPCSATTRTPTRKWRSDHIFARPAHLPTLKTLSYFTYQPIRSSRRIGAQHVHLHTHLHTHAHTHTPTRTHTYSFLSAFYDASEISEQWVLAQFGKIRTDVENVPPSNDGNTNTNVITPAEGLKRKADFPDYGRLSCLSEGEVCLFLKTFFSCSLDTAVEGGEGTMVLQARPKTSPSTGTELATGSAQLGQASASSVQPVLISIEGNIGAGKSFLLTRLRALHPEWCFIDEPVSFWESLKNDEGQSLLEVFYADQRRWSYTFQNCALLSRFNNIECTIKDVCERLDKEAGQAQAEAQLQAQALALLAQVHAESDIAGAGAGAVADLGVGGAGVGAVRRQVFITERCLDTDKYVFAQMLRDDGQLDAMEFDLYCRWFSLLSETATQLSAIVYVDTLPDMCNQRIRVRSREGEAGIPLTYLSNLDKYQRQWIDRTHVRGGGTLSEDVAKVEEFVARLVGGG
ncbi:P-loop containing nucleoside triphosphate hydrolase protein, partial [Ochromonadaceae sp. CCMP2298]